MEEKKENPPMEDILKTDRIFSEENAPDSMEDNMKSDRFIEHKEPETKEGESMEENMTTDRHLEQDNYPTSMEDVMKTDRYIDEREVDETKEVKTDKKDVDSDQATLDKEENA